MGDVTSVDSSLDAVETRHPLVASFGAELCASRALHEMLLPCLPDSTPETRGRERQYVPVTLRHATPVSGSQEVMEHHGIVVTRDGDCLTATSSHSSAWMGPREVEIRCARDVPAAQLHAIFNIIWPFVMPRFGLVHVHSGAVCDPDGQGWLLAGDANVGKSTSTLALVAAGWRYAADDAVYLERKSEQIVAHGWAEPIRLSARSAEALRVKRLHPTSGAKSSALLREDLEARREEGFPIHRLLFPRLGNDTRLRALSASDAFARLVRVSAWIMAQPVLAQDYAATLRTLAMLPAAELTLGPDLLDQPARLARHLQRGVAA